MYSMVTKVNNTVLNTWDFLRELILNVFSTNAYTRFKETNFLDD